MDEIKTELIEINNQNLDGELIYKAAEIIKTGGLVAFPTETVYGLGANGLNPEAVKKIFYAKGRPQDNPLILHVYNSSQVIQLAEGISKEVEELMNSFWPGPLTILFKKSNLVPDIITSGLDTVAIRMPNNPIALKLIELSQTPIAAPSANTSGKPSPTSAGHVIEDLWGKIDLVIDGGSTGIGVESTVLDMSGKKPTILRPGGITLEDLKKIIPNVEEDIAIIQGNENIVPKSPGQKYRHYAPKAEMIVYNGELENMVDAINFQARKYIEEGKSVGIMATDETIDEYNTEIVVSLGNRKEKHTIAHNLFNTIRLLDNKGVDIILAEGVEPTEIGSAIMNRLHKAAAGRIINV